MDCFTNSHSAIYASRLLYLLFFCVTIVLSCKKDNGQPTPATNLITANPTISGVNGASVSLSGSVYTITVPAGTNVKALRVNIPLTSGAKIDPDPTVARDYSNPISYTITAVDGTQQSISIKVVVDQAVKSSEKQISAFSFEALSPAVQANIDQSTYKITATIPANSDLTKLVPTITVLSKASVSPASGVAQNFTNPVAYTVTAEDGSKQTYEVKIDRVSSSNSEFILCLSDLGLHALDANTGSLKWPIQLSSPYRFNKSLMPVVYDGILYTAVEDENNYKYIIGININTGKKNWSIRLPIGTNAGSIYSNLAIENKIIYLVIQNHTMMAIDIGSASVKWTSNIYADIDFTGSPVVYKGQVYAMGEKNLYSFDANTGAKKWDFKLNSNIFEKPLAQDGVVYCADDKYFYAIDSDSGTLKWKSSIPSTGTSSPTLYDGMIYINGSSLYAIDAKNGDIKWTHNITLGSFNISSNYLFGSLNDYLEKAIITFDLKTGSIVSKKDIGLGSSKMVGVDGSLCLGDGLRVKMLNTSTGDIRWSYEPSSYLDRINPVIYIKNGKIYYPVESGMQQ